MGAVQAAAASFGMELTSIDIRDADTIERGISSFARQANGGKNCDHAHNGMAVARKSPAFLGLSEF